MRREINPLKEERLGWMAATFESVSDLVFIADLDDRFIYVNPAALKKLGYTKEELMGKTAKVIMSPRNPKGLRQKILKDTRWNLSGFEGEVINVTKTGEEYVAHLKTALVYNIRGEKIGMTGISRDVTEKIRIQKELERYAKKLKEANQKLQKAQGKLVRAEKLSTIGILASGLAHEIGNPLASLSSLVQLLQRKVANGNVQKPLASMMEHIERINQIIRKVEDFSKENQPFLREIDMETLLRESVTRFSRSRRKHENSYCR